MIMLAQDDTLRGLKRFTRLAEQDILLSRYTDNPNFWKAQAVARKSVYLWLTEIIRSHGVDHAYLFAKKRYEGLSHFHSPEALGQRDALEMFFVIIGQNRCNKEGELPVSAQVNG